MLKSKGGFTKYSLSRLLEFYSNNLVCALYTVFTFIFACFSKSLHLFCIFYNLVNYIKKIRGGLILKEGNTIKPAFNIFK